MARFTKLLPIVPVWAASAVGMRRPQHGRPVFVLSMPRSGSSWIGRLLGAADGAQYYREPFSRTHVSRPNEITLVDVSEDQVPPAYQTAKQRLVAGSALFLPSVIGDVDQWPPYNRTPARVVVKEVNPLASRWFIETYAPDFVMLIRHPADIALSFKARGWWQEDPTDPQKPWYDFGVKVGRCWTEMEAATATYDRSLPVRYEDICLNTAEEIQRIFTFVGMKPADGFSSLVGELGSADGQSTSDDPYGLVRDSSAQVAKWRETLHPDQASALAEGFAKAQLPKYYQYAF